MPRRRRPLFRRAAPALALALLAAPGPPLLLPHAAAQTRQTAAAGLSPAAKAALDRVSADSLRGRLSFLASDALAGRDTPSPGLDAAAAYIASEFRRAGLVPLGENRDYFQPAEFVLTSTDPAGVALTALGGTGGPAIRVDGGALTFRLPAGLDLAPTRVVKAPADLAAAAEWAKTAAMEGKVVCFEAPDFRRLAGDEGQRALAAYGAFTAAVRARAPALLLQIDRAGRGGGRSGGGGRPTLRSADETAPAAASASAAGVPTVTARSAELAGWFDALPAAGESSATVAFRAPAPVEQRVRPKNVAGLLRGSDPTLRFTYVLVSAHYDHLGVTGPDTGGNPAWEDRVFNGANDDGSGTVAVIELAHALASLNPRPKRSIVFLAYFGEEKGLLGSRYYTRNPLVPLAQTVANVNLEQIGRTDDSEGPRVAAANVTGFDYSGVGAVLKRAGDLTGVAVTKHPTSSDSFFARSDNAALAGVGVPAHTVSVAYQFPDYHGLEDHWEKIDYANLAKVTRMAGAGLLLLADDPAAPQWDAANPRVTRYRQAQEALRLKAAPGGPPPPPAL